MDPQLVIDHIANTCGAYAHGLPECPDCGAPLLSAYDEAGERGLTMMLTCSADCGFTRRAQHLRTAGGLARFGLSPGTTDSRARTA
jgi:hypothetical protein